MVEYLEKIAIILGTYGPAGAAAILIGVCERVLWNRYKAAGHDRRQILWLYSANWLCIALLVCVLTFNWVSERSQVSYEVRGRVSDLKLPARVIPAPSSGTKLFVNRERSDGLSYHDYFVLLSDQPSSNVSFRLDVSAQGKGGHEKWLEYTVNLKDAQYVKGDELALRYLQEGKLHKVLLNRKDGTATPLSPVVSSEDAERIDDVANANPTDLITLLLSPVLDVFAAEAEAIEEIERAL
jgi:hypothetical protein